MTEPLSNSTIDPSTIDPFAPAQLGPKTLRNRIIKSATFEGVMPEALVTPELIEYHRVVAAGGVGMTTVAYLAVSPEGRTHAECLWMREEAIPGLTKLTEAIHAEGALISGQIGHGGVVANSKSNQLPSIAPSKQFNPIAMRRVHEATEADISRVLGDFAKAARIAVRSGFDCLEIHLGHNYLPSSFLSPRLNKREDSWGGSLENRARFAREAVQSVRAEVNNEIAVIAKLNMKDAIPGGLELEESLEVAKMLEADGGLDALELTGGSSYGNPMYLFRGEAPLKEFAKTLPAIPRLAFKLMGKKMMPAYPFKEAFFREHARKYLAELNNLPLILLGGINELDTIKSALDEGFAFVAMGRALLRTPDLIARMQAGEMAKGVCIHCNRCMPTIYSGTRCVLDNPEPIMGGAPVA